MVSYITMASRKTGKSKAMVAILAILASLFIGTAGISPASAVQNFSNAAIADQALTHVGQWGGQCKQFANNMASAGSGGIVHLGGGYYTDYANAGGVQVGVNAAAKGDIIQLNGANVDMFYNGMHTAIVVSYLGNNTFDVVDSNWGTPLNNEIIHRHTWNPFATAAQYGLSVRIWQLGNVTVSDPHNPFGSLDVITRAPGGIRIQGWAIDSDTGSSPINVEIYSGSTDMGMAAANNYRSDVAGIFPQHGGYHGFDVTLAIGAGAQTVCAYGLNVGGGGNTQLSGCKTLTISGDPFGTLDSVTRVPGGVRSQGWAIDPDVSYPIGVDIYSGSTNMGRTNAGSYHSDLLNLYPGYGGYHAYDVTQAIGAGTQTLCAYGVNVAPLGGNTQLAGCKTITISGDPLGTLDAAIRAGSGVQLSGWAIDPDVAYPITVVFYTASGTYLGGVTSDGNRQDIGAAYPSYGVHHGYGVTLPVAGGSQTVCAYGINVAPLGGNTQLGCKNI